MSDEHTNEAFKNWFNVATAINSKAKKLGRELREKNWNTLKIRACMLKSKPTVAGWGCLFKKFNLSMLSNDDSQKEGYKNCIELGYTIVIPQEFGHAIITACERSDQTLIKDIAQIHRCIPFDVKSNELYIATKQTKKRKNLFGWANSILYTSHYYFDRDVQLVKLGGDYKRRYKFRELTRSHTTSKHFD